MKSPLHSIPKGTLRLYRICILLAIGGSIWGYNIGILSSILVHPGWNKALSHPKPWQKGIIAGIYYVGTLVSYLGFSHIWADRHGRRGAAGMGIVLLSFGAVMMAFAAGAGIWEMVVGRFVCGLGVGVVSTSVPLFQSELSPAKERGKFVTLNHVGFIAGLASGLWAGYGMSFWKGQQGEYWGWRVSIILQLIPALVFLLGLFLIPESPRWLMEKGQSSKAKFNLSYLRAETATPSQITHELESMTTHPFYTSSTIYSSSPSSSSFTPFRSPPLFARLWRAFLLQLMAQLCGATAMKYYLPTLLKALGINTQLALMAGAIEMTTKIGLTVVEMWVIDRFGRRACLVGGCIIMGVAMLVNGSLPLIYPGNQNKPADIICIIFIFIYAMGYSLGLGPAAWVYSSEIFPTPFRARGLNFAASGGSIGSILVSQIWPVGMAKLGSKVYFFFMAVNFICVPVIWMLYPETKGRALEDMDALFGKAVDNEPDGSQDNENTPLLA